MPHAAILTDPTSAFATKDILASIARVSTTPVPPTPAKVEACAVKSANTTTNALVLEASPEPVATSIKTIVMAIYAKMEAVASTELELTLAIVLLSTLVGIVLKTSTNVP